MMIPFASGVMVKEMVSKLIDYFLNIRAMTIEQETKEFYTKAWELLSEFGQKRYTATLIHGGHKRYDGIEVFASGMVLDASADYIKSLLAGMGYTISIDKNSETITIK